MAAFMSAPNTADHRTEQPTHRTSGTHPTERRRTTRTNRPEEPRRGRRQRAEATRTSQTRSQDPTHNTPSRTPPPTQPHPKHPPTPKSPPTDSHSVPVRVLSSQCGEQAQPTPWRVEDPKL